MISDSSSFDISEITAVLFVRALTLSPAKVKVTGVLSSCVQMSSIKIAEIQKKLLCLEIINLKKLEIYSVTFSGGIFGSLGGKSDRFIQSSSVILGRGGLN